MAKGLVTVNEDVVLKEEGKTYHVCPTFGGGRDWPQGAYNPRSNIMYIPLSNACIDETARTDREAAPQFVYNTTNVGKFAAGKDKMGRIDAISVETGRTVWSWETRVANYSPILATGGGLLFNGSMDRYLRALDFRQWPRAVGDAASLASGRRHHHVLRQGPAIHRRRCAADGAIANLQVGLTPEADTTPGSNALYVFALPQ